ncbi:MAG: hypothetical protein K8R02_01105 [Anaerohalosphaeraceae bacterium]|nr:hypothetical protein [Anaerohalosphaeraceae bacterium]
MLPAPVASNITAKAVFVAVLGFFTLAVGAAFDSKRHISIDEIKPGMDAYCLTVYKGVEIEKFNLKVVDVVRDVSIGRNAILVMGTDERFIHTGPVAGCSGSPVYIDGRNAGALAFGWSFSKDPLYGVTPIAEMLEVGSHNRTESMTRAPLDFSSPLDLKKTYEQMHATFDSQKSTNFSGTSALLCPLSSSLPAEAFAGVKNLFAWAGLMPVAGASSSRKSEYKDRKLEPGSILAIPMVSGDIELSAIGTVTEVDGDKIYAFGHSMTGQGPIDMPMATGYVNTVVASVVRSFKFGQSIDIKGALYADESTAIAGQLGKKAKTIPVDIVVDRFNDKKKTYRCEMISHRFYTPLLTEACIAGTAAMKGPLPTEHLIKYKVKIGLEGREPIEFENFSSAVDFSGILAHSVGAVGLIMNNPYKKIDITSMAFDIKIMPKTAISHIWSFDVSDSTVKPGQEITAQVTVQSYLKGLKKYSCQIKIPPQTPAGTYTLSAGGTGDYGNFKRKNAPYKYVPENLDSLISIINEIANTQNNRLHLLLPLPAGGVAIESSELPDLPTSKGLLLVNGKRASQTLAVPKWIEKTIETDTIIIDQREIKITVAPALSR